MQKSREKKVQKIKNQKAFLNNRMLLHLNSFTMNLIFLVCFILVLLSRHCEKNIAAFRYLKSADNENEEWNKKSVNAASMFPYVSCATYELSNSLAEQERQRIKFSEIKFAKAQKSKEEELRKSADDKKQTHLSPKIEEKKIVNVTLHRNFSNLQLKGRLQIKSKEKHNGYFSGQTGTNEMIVTPQTKHDILQLQNCNFYTKNVGSCVPASVYSKCRFCRAQKDYSNGGMVQCPSKESFSEDIRPYYYWIVTTTSLRNAGKLQYVCAVEKVRGADAMIHAELERRAEIAAQQHFQKFLHSKAPMIPRSGSDENFKRFSFSTLVILLHTVFFFHLLLFL